MRIMLTLIDREEISRGLAEDLLFAEIAVRIGRDPSVVSRDVARPRWAGYCGFGLSGQRHDHAEQEEARPGAHRIRYRAQHRARRHPCRRRMGQRPSEELANPGHPLSVTSSTDSTRPSPDSPSSTNNTPNVDSPSHDSTN